MKTYDKLQPLSAAFDEPSNVLLMPVVAQMTVVTTLVIF
jgi:hypothetical protein